jgi:hypothetical protein
MNATDLMLGDYVQIEYEEGNLITDYICDIGYVSQWNELGVRTCKCGNEWLRESEITPLFLTPEILEKNEFPLNREETNSTIQNVYRHYTEFFNFPLGKGFYIEYDTVDNVFWITDHAFIIFKCVHEFQHVLKLCGIDKKIVI